MITQVLRDYNRPGQGVDGGEDENHSVTLCIRKVAGQTSDLHKANNSTKRHVLTSNRSVDDGSFPSSPTCVLEVLAKNVG